MNRSKMSVNWGVGALVVILVVMVLVLVRLRHPEKLQGRAEAAPWGTAPAEPGAEGMNPQEAGEPSTGPGEDRSP